MSITKLKSSNITDGSITASKLANTYALSTDSISAGVYANTAIENASSASLYANTGITIAQASFNAANNVMPQIQPAFNAANSASLYANTGITLAQAAYNSSNTGTSANLAYTGTLTGGTGVVAIGTNQIYKDASGNVGIGTTSPAVKLDVVGAVKLGASNAGLGVDLYSNANWNYSNLNIWRNASNAATPRFVSFMLDGDSSSSTTIGGFNAIWGSYDSAPTTGSTSSALNGAMVYGAYAGHQWYTNGIPSMRIGSSGNLLVGTTSPYNATTDVLTVTRNQNAITQLLIDNQNVGASSQTRLALEASGGGWYIANQKTGNPLTFSNNIGVKMTIDSSGNLLVGTTSASVPSTTGFVSSANTFGFKNRIINGGMVIDQRNAGASVTPAGVYTLDRWVAFQSTASKFSLQQNAGAVTPPVGFSNYLGCTSLSAYSVLVGDYYALRQNIEGFNTADLGFGTASASSVTLSFRVYSSLTGTFGGAVTNHNFTRAYPFTYSIPVASTWTTISITIAGDTTGTWLTNNGVGIAVTFSLGTGTTYSGTAGAWAASGYISATGATSVVGTSGATFYITGVQLEKGSVATSFDQRAYSQELAMCQRYYQSMGDCVFGGNTTSGAALIGTIPFLVTMRAAPTITFPNIGYANASALSNWNSNPTRLTPQITITASGYGYTQFGFTASAEL